MGVRALSVMRVWSARTRGTPRARDKKRPLTLTDHVRYEREEALSHYMLEVYEDRNFHRCSCCGGQMFVCECCRDVRCLPPYH